MSWEQWIIIVEEGIPDCGAPHYHVLLWIQDAPVIGVDDPDKVLAWIEDRITCKLPDKESDSELHALVTK